MLNPRISDKDKELIENGVEHKDYVVCQLCGLTSTNISSHVTRVHKMKAVEYKQKYPGYELFSENLRNKFKRNITNNNPNDNPDSINKMKETKAKKENRDRRSKKMKENFATGKIKPAQNIGRGLNGIRPDLGHDCRSMWEANVARVLKLKEIEYKFEVKAFPFYENGELINSYLPDFYLPKYNKVIEVKGQMDETSLTKLTLFKKHYPEIKVFILEDRHYDWLTKKFKDIIGKKWEYSKRNIKTHPHLFEEMD